MLDRNAYFWRCNREWWRSWGGWLAVVLLIGLFAGGASLLGLAPFRMSVLTSPYLLVLLWLLHFVLKYMLASEAARGLAIERQEGTLELLLSTSLAEQGIIEGQWAALRHQFGGPILAVLLMDTATVLSLWLWQWQVPNWRYEALFVVVTALMLLLDARALGWAGMWKALASPTRKQTVGGAFGQVVVFPWIVIIVAVPFVGFGTRIPFLRGSQVMQWLVLGCAVRAAYDVYMMVSRRRKLFREFRRRARERFAERKGFSWF